MTLHNRLLVGLEVTILIVKVMKSNKYIFDSMSVCHVAKSNLLLDSRSSTLHHFCWYYITGQTINNT